MFPYTFTTKLVLPTPAPLNSPTLSNSPSPVSLDNRPKDSSNKPLYMNGDQSPSNNNNSASLNTSSKTRVEQLKTDSYNYTKNDSVHDTLTDIDEAISEITSSNPSYDNIISSKTNATPPFLNQQQQQHYISNTPSLNGASSALERFDVMSWTPTDVRDYFLSLNYEPSVCDCFVRHQITGPILLELDLAYLKEIDIPSFGTRFQISKNIKNLNSLLKSNQNASNNSNLNSNDYQQQTPPADDPNLPYQMQMSQPQQSKPSYAIDNPPPNSNNLQIASNPQGLASPPSFKRQSLLRTAKDNEYLNSYLHQQKEYSPKRQSKHSEDGGLLDFPLKNDGANGSPTKQSPSNGKASRKNSHKKDPSFDPNWTVKSASKQAEKKDNEHSAFGKERASKTKSDPPNAQMKHGRFRASTISTADQYYHDNRSSVESNPPAVPSLDEFNYTIGMLSNGGNTISGNNRASMNSGRKSSYVEETRKRHGSSHSRQTSSDTIRGASGASGSSEPSAGDASSTLYSSHKHSRSASSFGLSDFKYLNKFPTDDSFVENTAQDEHQIYRRRSSLLSVILTGGDTLNKTASDDGSASNSPISKKEAVAAVLGPSTSKDESAIDDEDESEYHKGDEAELKTVKGKRVSTDPTASTTNEGGELRESSSRSFMKKKSLRSSSSHSNLRKSGKKKTSAFMEGIQNITPTEAAKNADFSGWMNKRGSVAVGTWKARFFTLKGTRLSYFSSFSDTKEKGLIDITSHRVVPVGEEDKFVAIYAASVGAGRHCFKLVPPSPGSRKGVTFTVPKVHYFAVDSREEMRNWINALMKATIDRDDSVPVVSSCATPTVSLAKAREMFAEARIREEELRAKAVAENAGGSSLFGNQINATWLNGFGSNFYNGTNNEDSNSSPNSPSHSGSLRSSATGSSVTGSSSANLKSLQGSNGANKSTDHFSSTGSLVPSNNTGGSGMLDSLDSKSNDINNNSLENGFSTKLGSTNSNTVSLDGGSTGSVKNMIPKSSEIRIVTDLE